MVQPRKVSVVKRDGVSYRTQVRIIDTSLSHRVLRCQRYAMPTDSKRRMVQRYVPLCAGKFEHMGHIVLRKRQSQTICQLQALEAKHVLYDLGKRGVISVSRRDYFITDQRVQTNQLVGRSCVVASDDAM